MADEPTDGDVPEQAGEPADEFDGLVLDDNFVRDGAYEPPARTRVAIARYGNQQTSWRHGGGLRRPPAQPLPPQQSAGARRPGRAARSSGPSRSNRRGAPRSTPPALPSPAMARLPLIVTIVVVAVAAFLTFR